MLHNFTQNERINIAEVKYLYFSNDFLEFQNLNPIKFTNLFMNDFRTAIDTVIAFRDDELVVDEGQELTQTVAQLMEDARKLYKHLKYFIEETYQNNEPRKNRFGLDNYEEARKSPINMVAFLTQLHTQATFFQNDLTTTGLNPAKIADILPLRNQLQQANAAQKAFTGERQELTQERTALLEMMDSFTQAVCKAGKLIYENNPAKYRQYTLYQTSSTTATNVHNISGTSTEVAENSTPTPITQATVFRLENQGNTALQFYCNDSLSDAAPSNAISLAAGATVEITASEIVGTGYNLLIVRNEEGVAGKYVVRRLQEVM
jgi:hypothetical protein